MKAIIRVSFVCMLAVVVSHLPSQCNAFGEDMFDFAKTQLNQVSEKVVRSLHRSASGGRPGPLPDSRGPRGGKLGNNKYVSAMLQVNKAMAEARGRRYSFKANFLKKVARLAVDANELKHARDVFGYGLYEDYKQYKQCMASRRRNCGPTSNGIAGQIRTLIGDQGFNKLMAVEGNVDLIFTIDTTGSMRAEINAAKAIVRSIATYDREAGVNYTLSPFNDPRTGPVQRFTDRSAFLRALDNLHANGGGDCEELTFHGIYNAIEQTKPPLDSPMFVFTDAGPKDVDADDISRDDAIGKALDYCVPVNFFYSKNSGVCKAPTTYEAFHEIVDATEGISLLFDKEATDLEHMGEIVSASLDGMTTIKSGRKVVSPAGLRGRGFMSRRRPFRPRARGRNTIPVDDSVEKLIVVITVERNPDHVVLRNPFGRTIRKTYGLINGGVWVIKRPRSGQWSLEIPSSVGSHSYKVTSSSVLNIDFDYYFITRQRTGNTNVEIPITEPLTGTPAIVKVLIPLKEKLRLRSLYLDTVDKYGETLSSSAITIADTTARFNRPPSVPFKLRLRGITSSGLAFERLSRKITTAKSAILRMVSNRNYFTLPRARTNRRSPTWVRFVIHNSGATDTFNVNLDISVPSASPSLRIQVIRPPRAGGYLVRTGAQKYVTVGLFVPRALHPGQFTRMFVEAIGVRTGVKARLSVQLMVL